MMKSPFAFFCLCAILLQSCFNDETGAVVADGLRPIYASQDELNISWSQPKPYDILGQIVYRDPYIFINEQYKGVHVVDNSNPVFPEKVGFIQIAGCNNFTIKNDFLYANSGADLITLKYNNGAITETARIKNFYSGEDLTLQVLPPNYSGFFECIDPSNGVIVGWIEDSLTNPQCQTLN